MKELDSQYPVDRDPNRYRALPRNGHGAQGVLEELNQRRQQDCDWQDGKCFGFVYHGGKEHVEFMNKVYGMFSQTNPLHTSAFKSVAAMEQEVCVVSWLFLVLCS